MSWLDAVEKPNKPIRSQDKINSYVNETVLDGHAKITAAVNKAILEAHATGLQQAAILVGDMAHELAISETSEGVTPSMSASEKAAAGKILAEVNARIMARIEAVKVVING